MLHEIKKVYRSVPFIVMSGYLDKDKKTALINAGANDFILKPFRSNDLLGKIRKTLDQH